MVREVVRVLLVTPPTSSADSESTCAPEVTQWTGLAASLRGAGLQTEVFDAARGQDLDSFETQLEHFWPQVVVTRADAATSEGAWAVLRAAKTIVPGVVTVMSGGRAGEAAGQATRAGAADHDLRGAGEEAEFELLARLREGTSPETLKSSRATRRRRVPVLSTAWSLISHGR